MPSERIAVGIDGSLESRAAVRWAVDHARSGDTITLLYAWRPSQARGAVHSDDEEAAAKEFARHELAHASSLRRNQDVEVDCQAVQGDPRKRLCDYKTDLLIVGARGQNGIAGVLLGSVTSHLARHAQVPIVIVPCPIGHDANRPRT